MKSTNKKKKSKVLRKALSSGSLGLYSGVSFIYEGLNFSRGNIRGLKLLDKFNG